MKSKKEALDDAISATKAAVAEGIVPGGGLALLRCTEAVAAEEAKCTGDERTGLQILRRALEAPARQIAENSSIDGGVVVARMLEGKGNYGFDAARKEMSTSWRRASLIRPRSSVSRSRMRICGKRAAAHGSDHDGGSGREEGVDARSGDGHVGVGVRHLPMKVAFVAYNDAAMRISAYRNTRFEGAAYLSFGFVAAP